MVLLKLNLKGHPISKHESISTSGKYAPTAVAIVLVISSTALTGVKNLMLSEVYYTHTGGHFCLLFPVVAQLLGPGAGNKEGKGQCSATNRKRKGMA